MVHALVVLQKVNGKVQLILWELKILVHSYLTSHNNYIIQFRMQLTLSFAMQILAHHLEQPNWQFDHHLWTRLLLVSQ